MSNLTLLRPIVERKKYMKKSYFKKEKKTIKQTIMN